MADASKIRNFIRERFLFVCWVVIMLTLPYHHSLLVCDFPSAWVFFIFISEYNQIYISFLSFSPSLSVLPELNETMSENNDTVGQIVSYIMKNEGTCPSDLFLLLMLQGKCEKCHLYWRFALRMSELALTDFCLCFLWLESFLFCYLGGHVFTQLSGRKLEL